MTPGSQSAKRRRGQLGVTLVEVLVSLALLGIIGAGFLGATATTSSSRVTVDEHASAKTLAESTMDTIKKATFASSYNVTVPDEYAGYTVNLTVEEIRTQDMQLITVSIERRGTALFSLEDYKVTR